MSKPDFEFSHLHLWVGDVDAFKRRCEEVLGWRVSHYAPGIVVSFEECPFVSFEHGHDSKFQLAVKSLNAQNDSKMLGDYGLEDAKPLERKPDGRVQAWKTFWGKSSLEIEEDVANSLTLVPPSEAYRLSFLAAIRDFQAEGLHTDIDPCWGENDFRTYLNGLEEQRHVGRLGRVPCTVRWAVCNGEFLGRLSIRHELNIPLGESGGHIGFDVAPRFRGRGIAKAMLRKSLPLLKNLGFRQALLTCDATNSASRRVMEACGARFQGTFTPADGVAKHHYVLDVRP